MFSAFLVVGIFGMLMITLRSALLPDAFGDEWYEGKDEGNLSEEGFEVDEEDEVVDTAHAEQSVVVEPFQSHASYESQSPHSGELPDTSQSKDGGDKSWLALGTESKV